MLTFWSLNSLRAVIQVTSSVPEYEQGLLKYFFGDHAHELDKWKKKKISTSEYTQLQKQEAEIQEKWTWQ